MSLIEILGGNRGHGVGAVLEKVMAEDISGAHAKKKKNQSSDLGTLMNPK